MRWPHVLTEHAENGGFRKLSPKWPISLFRSVIVKIFIQTHINWYYWWVYLSRYKSQLIWLVSKYLYLMIYSHSKPILVASHEHLWWLSWRASRQFRYPVRLHWPSEKLSLFGYLVIRREWFGAIGLSIFPFYFPFNGEPFGATNRVSQPSDSWWIFWWCNFWRTLGAWILWFSIAEMCLN